MTTYSTWNPYANTTTSTYYIDELDGVPVLKERKKKVTNWRERLTK